MLEQVWVTEVLMDDTEGKKFHFDNRYWEKPQKYEMISLYQIGDLSCREGFEIGEHNQLCFEISYIFSGKGWCVTNGAKYPVSKGDIFISLPGDRHNMVADKLDPFRYLYLAFWFNYFQDKPNPYRHIDKMFKMVGKPVMHDRLSIDIPFKSVLQELYVVTEFSQEMIESYLLQIIILAYRNFCSPWEQQYNPLRSGGETKSKEIVYCIISYIDNHLQEIESLKHISETFNYSYSHLSHIFREETGISLQTYFNNKKMDLAIQLIRSGDLSNSGIAERLHYQTIHSFSKAFKKVLGMSPAQYRHFISGKEG